MLPSLSALRAFDAAARLGSFRAAAENLSVSATAISHHVRGLEEYLQTSLFDRVGRNVTLTEDGKRLADATASAFTTLQDAIESFRTVPRRSVRIAAGPIFTARWLMPRISDFWAQYPGIELEFVPSYRPGEFQQNHADIVIRWDRLSEMPGEAVKLLELQPIAVASPEFVEKFGPFEQPSDLLSVPILHQRNHWGWIDWFSAQNVRIQGTPRGAVFEDANVLIRGAAEGQGAIVGWLPLIDQDLKDGRVVRLFSEEMPPTHGYFVQQRDGASTRRETRVAFEWLCGFGPSSKSEHILS